MDTKQAEVLMQKYLDGTASPEERAIFESWYNQTVHDNLSPVNEPDYEALEMRLAKSLPAGGRKVYKLWLQPAPNWIRRVAVAAAAIAAITLGVWLYNISNISRHPEFISGSPLVNNIAPGKNTATLTLADGKVINLDTGRTSVVVADSIKAMTMLTASTPRGGTYQVILPDGTNVWLNAASSISFPSQFNGKERKILLEGEAYFEVEKDKTRPFIVSTETQDVTVLGTHFNVSSYEDETNTKTTLLEGSISVRYAISDRHPELVLPPAASSRSGPRNRKTTMPENVILKPNEQAVLIPSGQIKVTEVDTDEVIAWKNGLFSYTSAPLDVVLKQVSRWYNVEVEYLNETSKSQTFTGSVSRYDNVSRLLKAIEYTGAVKFKIEGKKIIVTN